MCEQMAWMPMVIALFVVGLGGVSPVWARQGFNTVDMPAIRTSPPMNFAEPSKRQRSNLHNQGMAIGHDLRFHGHPRSQGTLPVLIWPYDPYFESYSPTTAATGTEPSPEPQIIVMPSSPQPQGTAAQETRLDFSYVGGCHAIPNGYHCDSTDASKQP